MERLQKIISQAGICSRREAEVRIKAGRVAVNDQIITELGVKADLKQDRIAVDGVLISGENPVYVLLNKPACVVTTMADPQGRKTVTAFLCDIKERLYPVGRLDYHTEGLLLLTNDGDLTNQLTHPRNHVNKTYIAKVIGMATEDQLDKLRTGIALSDGVTAPALVRILETIAGNNQTVLEITIHEGKNRQVRRMCEAIGHPIQHLARTKLAFLTTKGLKLGCYRHLTEDEVRRLKELGEK